ncbi:MAG TPA: hypothetical protein VJ396_09660 [Acidiferrobacterales bacterium]|nr:hypothetical protein [Acidiferrobacterales bacterium]
MKELSFISLFTAIALSISACATFNVNHDYTLDPNRSEGLAVVSLSFEGLVSAESPTWRYRRLDQESDGFVLTDNTREPLDWNSPPGRLAYFTLSPGHYEFYQSGFARVRGSGGQYWTIGPGGAPTNSNSWYSSFNTPTYDNFNAETFSVKFEIRPGMATYIGNLHLVWQENRKRGEVQVRDRTDRDTELLKKRLPALLKPGDTLTLRGLPSGSKTPDVPD